MTAAFQSWCDVHDIPNEFRESCFHAWDTATKQADARHQVEIGRLRTELGVSSETKNKKLADATAKELRQLRVKTEQAETVAVRDHNIATKAMAERDAAMTSLDQSRVVETDRMRNDIQEILGRLTSVDLHKDKGNRDVVITTALDHRVLMAFNRPGEIADKRLFECAAQEIAHMVERELLTANMATMGHYIQAVKEMESRRAKVWGVDLAGGGRPPTSLQQPDLRMFHLKNQALRDVADRLDRER